MVTFAAVPVASTAVRPVSKPASKMKHAFASVVSIVAMVVPEPAVLSYSVSTLADAPASFSVTEWRMPPPVRHTVVPFAVRLEYLNLSATPLLLARNPDPGSLGECCSFVLVCVLVGEVGPELVLAPVVHRQPVTQPFEDGEAAALARVFPHGLAHLGALLVLHGVAGGAAPALLVLLVQLGRHGDVHLRLGAGGGHVDGGGVAENRALQAGVNTRH